MVKYGGLGSYFQPIVILSDDEDAADVENELNRWNDSPSSSTQESPIISNTTPHTLHSMIVTSPSSSTNCALPTSPSLKRKWHDVEAPVVGPVPAPTEVPSKRSKKKKQKKPRTDAVPLPEEPQTPIFKYDSFNSSERQWASGWSGNSFDSAVARPLISVPAVNTPPTEMRWVSTDSYDRPLGVGVGPGSSSFATHPYVPFQQGSSRDHLGTEVAYRRRPSPPLFQPHKHSLSSPASASRGVVDATSFRASRTEGGPQSVNTSLDDSLRRLQELSASLLSQSMKLPAVVVAETKVSPTNIDSSDKRRIGKSDDKANNGLFELAVLPAKSPALPLPIPSRTVVVTHLPKKFRIQKFVSTWAKRFGNVARLELEVKAGKALVEFDRPQQAEAAFASPKLRGDGKEHIRVYWYRGSTSSPLPPTTRAGEVEEGEIEEGEVVEVTPPPAPKTKKKKKGKKKTQTIEDRFTNAVVALTSPTSHAAATAAIATASHPTPPHPSSSQTYSSYPTHAASPPIPSLRPSLEERFSDALPTIDGVWEEEMELESDDDHPRDTSLAPSPPLVATVIDDDVPMDDDNVAEWECEADMDVAASSPLREIDGPVASSIPSRGILTPSKFTSLKRPRSPSPLGVGVHRPSPAKKSALETIRGGSEIMGTTRLEGGVRLDPVPYSDASSGTSATPEPVTPGESSVSTDIAIASLSTSGHSTVVHEQEASTHAPTEPKAMKRTVDLEELAVSFITESIQGVIAPPRPPPKAALPLPFKSSLPPPHPSLPQIPPPLQLPAPVPAPSVTPHTSEAAQLLAKKQRLEEYITTSKVLLAKIAAAKTKAEKDKLMRLLKEKQREMDFALRENHASPSTPSVRVLPTSSTPVPKTTLFRWPETPREMIIDISDDEADTEQGLPSVSR
ncbi:hypothetical protein C8Q78DRAFT_1055092 [Trametes maxima]|nr:hypothetical protein C8Q78DRAFT_1055092 [Trametes maxima]